MYRVLTCLISIGFATAAHAQTVQWQKVEIGGFTVEMPGTVKRSGNKAVSYINESGVFAVQVSPAPKGTMTAEALDAALREILEVSWEQKKYDDVEGSLSLCARYDDGADSISACLVSFQNKVISLQYRGPPLPKSTPRFFSSLEAR